MELKDKIKAALEEKRTEAQTKWAEFDAARKAAREEGADLTSTESEAFTKLEELHKGYATAAQEAKTLEDRLVSVLEMEGITEPKAALHGADRDEERERKAQTAGQRILESEEYKALKASGYLDNDLEGLRMSPVKALDRAELKTLMTGASETSAGALVENDRIPGLYVDIPRRPRVMSDLVMVGETDSDLVEYVEMTSRTNAAAEKPEATGTGDSAADAPESGAALAVKTSPVQEIKHFIPATRRALADAGQLRTIVDQELREGVLERLDSQMLVGNGTAPNLRGILNTAGIGSQAKGGDSRSDAVHKAITLVRIEFYNPDAVLFHPNDWQDLRLEKDANGNYLYGPPSQAGATTIWGLPVVLSTAISEGTALVGAYRRGASLWLRAGVAIAATDSHSDWFIRGLVAVLASMRAAFAAQRPKAFAQVTGL